MDIIASTKDIGMDFSIEQGKARVRIAIVGDLDAAMVQDMRGEVEALFGDPRLLVFDLTRVEFLDSAGVGLIVRTYKSRQAAKAAMAVAGASGQPRELLATTQIDRIIPFHATLDDIGG